eukprot:CAMPEP_0185714528 /NCGR_PEP_ID=MMETSP1164-20130828/38983_1 /TAXON_ID=1104430 /ORGANISM="Chrysoreinhardia sp, Strain CCMP2950" /LENGTH=571 /DNA_ID=CAMNT_0028382107 /DNA_START=54 /DNA_END=1769 /DNA_ORIENTATION=+
MTSKAHKVLLKPADQNAILPGLLGRLPLALQQRLADVVARGLLGPTDLDPKLIAELSDFDESDGLLCIDRFLSTNLAGIRNKSGFMVGVLNRFKAERGTGGASATPAIKHPPEGTAPPSTTTTTTISAPPKLVAPPTEVRGATVPKPDGTDATSRTVHVGHLTSQVGLEVLRQIFECIGPVASVRRGGDDTYAFVEFTDAAAADAAINMTGTQVRGCVLKVNRATPKTPANPLFPGATTPSAAAAAVLSGVPGGAVAPTQLVALANITSPAALAALQKQAAAAHAASTKAPGGGDDTTFGGVPPGNGSTLLEADVSEQFAHLNPAQQRAAIEERHRSLMLRSQAQTTMHPHQAWGMSRRRSTSPSENDSDDESDDDSRRSEDRSHNNNNRRERGFPETTTHHHHREHRRHRSSSGAQPSHHARHRESSASAEYRSTARDEYYRTTERRRASPPRYHRASVEEHHHRSAAAASEDDRYYSYRSSAYYGEDRKYSRSSDPYHRGSRSSAASSSSYRDDHAARESYHHHRGHDDRDEYWAAGARRSGGGRRAYDDDDRYRDGGRRSERVVSAAR